MADPRWSLEGLASTSLACELANVDNNLHLGSVVFFVCVFVCPIFHKRIMYDSRKSRNDDAHPRGMKSKPAPYFRVVFT